MRWLGDILSREDEHPIKREEEEEEEIEGKCAGRPKNTKFKRPRRYILKWRRRRYILKCIRVHKYMQASARE